MTDVTSKNIANGMRRIKRIHFIGLGGAGFIRGAGSPLDGRGVNHA